MNDTDPILIEFLVNRPEVLADLEAIAKGSKNVDDAVARTQQRFDAFVKTEATAGKETKNLKEEAKNLGTQLLNTGGNVERVKDVLGDYVAGLVTSEKAITTLVKVKEGWDFVNKKVAAGLQLLGLGEEAAATGATVLISTLTLGVGAAIAGLLYMFDQWKEKHDKLIEQEIKFSDTVADMAAESIVHYKALQEQWNSLGDDMQAKQKFVDDNQDAFKKLGISVDDVGSAENVFVRNTGAMLAALKERAKAAAAMQLAIEEYKLQLKQQAEYERKHAEGNMTVWENFMNTLNSGPGNIFAGKVKKDEQEAVNEHEKNVDKYITANQKAQRAENNWLAGAGVKPAGNDTKSLSPFLQGLKNDDENLNARYGSESKKYIDHHRNLLNETIKFYSDDKKEKAKYEQELRVFNSSVAKQQDDDAAQAQKEREKKAEAARKKAEAAAKAHAEKIAALNNEVDRAANSVINKTNQDNSESGKINTLFDNLKQKAQELKAAQATFDKIEVARKAALQEAKYKDDTKELLKNLDNQKEIYAAFEAYKTKVGTEEAEKRYSKELGDFKTFGELLQTEIDKFSGKDNLTFAESERLKGLKEMQTKYNIDWQKEEERKFADALEASQTYQEKVALIEEKYREQKKLLEKNFSREILRQKLELLELNRKAEIQSASDEAYQKTEAYRKLGDVILEMTKKQLEERLVALRAYLETAKNLTPEQKADVQKKIDDTQNILKSTQYQTRLAQLEERKKNLIAAQNALLGQQAEKYAEIEAQIQDVNKQIKAAPYQQIADWSSMIESSFGDLANAIGDSNDGLSDTLSTISTIAGAVNDVASGIAKSIMSGNPIAAIGGVISGIAKILSLGKAARESEKKAAEEIKKRQEEQFQAMLDYNSELRKRLVLETKINDLYKSRVDNIKEEIAANKKNLASVLQDEQTIFNKLLNSRTIIGQHTEKYGGFLGIGRKTKVVDETKTIAELLGIGSATSTTIGNGFSSLLGFPKLQLNGWNAGSAQLTDEIFAKLEKLNSEHPLTGDAKTAYEQLKKLRDEYGSIEEAQRQLEIELKNAITGTTAQSLGDSIKEGILSGKKSFADFADDIQGFLRNAIIAGMSAKIIEPEIQKLQDALAGMMGDGILTSDEMKQFQDMYMKIANDANAFMNVINQTGIGVTGSLNSANSLQGALKGASQESIDVLSGHTAGMRTAQLETNNILKNGFANVMNFLSKMVGVQLDIEKNTRRTADNTEKINSGVDKLNTAFLQEYNDLKSKGII